MSPLQKFKVLRHRKNKWIVLSGRSERHFDESVYWVIAAHRNSLSSLIKRRQMKKAFRDYLNEKCDESESEQRGERGGHEWRWRRTRRCGGVRHNLIVDARVVHRTSSACGIEHELYSVVPRWRLKWSSGRLDCEGHIVLSTKLTLGICRSAQ